MQYAMLFIAYDEVKGKVWIMKVLVTGAVTIYNDSISYRTIDLYGDCGYPFNESNGSYASGICPTCEVLYDKTLFSHELMRPFITKKDLDDVVKAFQKVYEHVDELREE